jgi:Fe-coproporphyrin III synthase
MSDYLRKLNERVWPAHLMFGPKNIVLGVNNFCNLKCRMCDVGTGNDESNFGANLVGAKTRSMPFDLFQRIAQQIKQTYPTARLAFAFTEPLAWQPLGDALALCRQLGLYASVTTNGLLLERRAKDLSDGGCRELSVSLDGPDQLHDQIRRHAGSYARAIAGIKAIAAMPGAPPISIFCTITEWNVGALVDFLDGLRELPVRRVGLIHNNFITQDQADIHNERHGEFLHATASNVFQSDPSKIDISALSDELTRIKAATYPFLVSIQPKLGSVADLDIYYRNPARYVGKRCNDVKRILMIDSDGEAIPAHGRCFRFPIGNIRTMSLAQMWNHHALSNLRRTLHEAGGLLPACSRCCGGFAGASGTV